LNVDCVVDPEHIMDLCEVLLVTVLLRLFAGEKERRGQGEDGTEAVVDPHLNLAGREVLNE